MATNRSFLEFIGVISYENESERLAAKRLEYMKKESYYANLRRECEKELVELHTHQL